MIVIFWQLFAEQNEFSAQSTNIDSSPKDFPVKKWWHIFEQFLSNVCYSEKVTKHSYNTALLRLVTFSA